MHIKNLHHRHWVAAPIAALLLAVSVTLAGSDSMTASVTAGPHDQLRGAGVLTAASEGFSTVTLSDHASVASFHGAIMVTRTDKSLTIAALSTPAVLRVGDDLFLIPTGNHVSIDAAVLNSDEILGGLAFEVLPRTYTEEALAKIADVTTPASTILSLTSIAPFAPNPLVIVPESRERERQEWAERTVQAMLAQLRRKSDAIDDRIWTDLEGTEALKSHLSDLIGAGLHDADLLGRLVPKLLLPEQRLLAYVHPDLRGAAWYGGTVEQEEESVRRTLIAGLPLTDTSDEGLSDFIVFRWQQLAEQMLRDRAGVTQFFGNNLPPIVTHLKRIREHGYPERFTRFGRALETLASSSKYSLPPIAVESLDELRRMETLPVTDVIESVAASVASSSQASSVSPPPVLSEAEQEQRAAQARAMLSERGAVFSMETTLTGQPDGTVQVANIVFSTAEQSHVYSFTFNPATANLSAITRDGQPQAYGLSLENFVQWAENSEK